MSNKLPRGIRMLAQHGAAALQPTWHGKRYNGPIVPKRIAANLRKRSIAEGTYGSFNPEFGGWDPAWDTPKKMHNIRPFKGHLRERSRPERADKITKAMQGMPARIAKLKQEVNDRKPKKDTLFMYKRIQEQSKFSVQKKGSKIYEGNDDFDDN